MSSKASTSAPAPTSAPAASPAPVESAIELSINEFCTRLSATVRRSELIGAFCHVETAAGRVKATEAQFKARFDEFKSKPV